MAGRATPPTALVNKYTDRHLRAKGVNVTSNDNNIIRYIHI